MPPFVPRYTGDYRLPESANKAAVDNYLQALVMRRKAHEMVALWGGKMPHQQAIVPGGVTEVPDTQKIFEFKTRLKELSDFIDGVYVPTVKAVANAYTDYFDIGQGCMNMLVYGAFPLEEGMDHVAKKKYFKSGVLVRGQHQELDPAKIGEEVKYSWFKDGIALDPANAVLEPDAEKKNAYSWIKAPRYNGEVMEVGPLARQIISGNPDVAALGTKAYSVMGRHFARAVECSTLVKAMDEWVMQLEPGKPVSTPHKVPAVAQGMGLTEAARGALGHWNRIDHQRTAVYNAIVPSTWNMSPKDGMNQRGTMEQALIGVKVADNNNPIELVRVIRSFDPCLACAIHIMTPDKKVIKQFQIN